MNNSRYIWGAILVVAGLSALTGFNIWHFIVPLALIVWGISMLSGHNSWPQGGPASFRELTIQEQSMNEILIFSGTKKRIESNDFKGGRIVAICGGAEVDLREVKVTAKEIKIEVEAVCGGIKLQVPAKWNIHSEVAVILGGFDNKTQLKKEKEITVHVTGAAVLGGVEVFN